MREEDNHVADHPPILPVASFCAGVGMLDLGFSVAVPGAEPVLYLEREVAAARILAARMSDGAVARAPVWSDLCTFDGRPWAGRVFAFTAGLPCQPYSLAGKQQGVADARSFGQDGQSGPVPQFLRIVAEVRPALVFLENVSAWVMGGHFRSVGEELSSLGYVVQKPLFIAAQDVGASHRRERVFILAHAPDSDWWGRIGPAQEGAGPGGLRRRGLAGGGPGLVYADGGPGGVADGYAVERGRPDQAEQAGMAGGGAELADRPRRGCGELRQPSGSDEELADADGSGQRSGGEQEQGALSDAGGSNCLADTESAGFQGAGHPRPPRRDVAEPCDRDRPVLPLFAPGPNSTRWPDILAAGPTLEPAICGVADGLAARVDRLRAAGNGVVPLQASAAAGILLTDAGLGWLCDDGKDKS